MSATDARTDLRMARDRIHEAIKVAEADRWPMDCRAQLEEALDLIGEADHCIQVALTNQAWVLHG